ncbi:Poly(beta-D-mannuronate) C5 epimerase 1 [Pseudomonas reidholzensis]|uniref:Poly(Beta-D-mannuronate) C5 epimerase 1 n=1 Tax=Pseudomonas reidholzensis TaxID=1785162 RepID=A0A383S1G7_9PSED|nr:immunoglobulin-like domain-containing protein [Pseudomonas reidholzensis]SYX93119.1 Poly(beta-D-mannuronate) C5 epimerase 1 [Pseudomonas reidholzensis]
MLTYTFNGPQHHITLDDEGHGSLNVANPNGEDVYVDGGTLTLTVDSGTGGGFEKIGTSAGTVVVSDTETPVTAIVTASPVNEGQDITFNFAMSAAPKAGSDPVVLTYTFNGQQHQITLDDKGHGSLTVANPNGEDVYVDAGSLTLTVDSGTGGGFEKIGTSAGTVQVNDTETPVTAIVTANPVNEGQDITFNFAMSSAPKAGSDPVVLTYTFNGQQHQITLDATGHGSLTVANPNGEDVYVDAGSLTLTVESGTGGGFEKIGTSNGTVVVSDTETPVTAIVTASPVNEGQDITFNFAMSSAPKAGSDPVVLTYTFNGQQHQITLDATGHGSLTVANPNGEDVYVDAGSLTLTVDSGTGGGFEKIGTSNGTVVVSDTETPVTAIVTANPVNEGQDITFNFAMSSAPKAGSDPVVLTYTFNGQQHQITLDATGHGSLTVANPNGEDVYVDAGTLTLQVQGGTGGGYEKIGTSAGTVQVNDTETPVTAIVTANPVNEGQDITFNFQMSVAPKAGSAPVVLTYTFNGQQHQITLDDKGHASLTVANPNTEDGYLDPQTLTLSVQGGTGGSYEKISPSSGTVEVRDTLNATTVAVTAHSGTEADAKVNFSFQLSTVPQEGYPATLTVKVGESLYIVPVLADGSATLAINNTNTEDFYKDSSQVTAKVVSINGGNFEATDVTGAQDTANIVDTINDTFVQVTADAAKEGDASVFFHFQLSNPPAPGSTTILKVDVGGTIYNVTVDATGKYTLAVPNTNAEDVYRDASNLTATVVSVTGGNYENVNLTGATATANIADTIDTVYAKISIVGDSSVTEGGTLTYKVELVDKSGNAVSVPAGKSVTVDLTWSGTADATDVTGNLPTSVTISGNSSNTTFQVQTFDDIKIESTETLIATINKVNDSSNVFEKVDIGSQKTATGSIVDNDKGPTFTGNDSATIVESGTAGGADVVLVLDRSGSMGPAGNGQQGSDPDGSGPYTSRLQMLKEAVKNLFDSGTVHSVFIVSFASSATFANSGKDGGWFTNLTDAYAAIDKLAASGNTNYASALNSVINNYTAPPAGGSKLVSVFMSDGVPNDASANESTWINFLNNKGFDDSYAVGFGGLSNTDKNYLEPIAWKPGETVGSITQGVNDNHVLVVGTNVSALTQALVGSVGGSATSGDVTSNASAGTAGWAANGWKLTAVEYNGVTYNLTSASDSKTIDLGNVGKLVIKGDGSYTFSGKDNFDTADSLSTVVKFTVKDANGTTASSTLTLTVTDRGDPVAKNDDHTATISSQTVTTAATTSTLATFTSNESNPWKFSSVDRDWADLSSNSVLKDNLSSWQSSSLAGNSNNQDAQRNSSNKLTLTDTNGSSYGDGQALTPVYKTGGAAGEVLSFTAVTSFASTPWYDSGTDTASWTLYKSTDGGNNWTIAQSGMIGSGSSTITTNALDANTQYRILLDVNDNTWTNSNASVTFDDFKVTVPGTSSIVWTAAAVVGSVLDNDTLGTSGETSTLSVKVNGVWVDASSAGTTVNGEYGSLVINKDGSYTYTPVASKDNIGHVDQFEYKLTQADGDTDTAHLYVTLQGAGPGATGLAPVWTSGNDNLLGTDGNDIIFGGAGNDYLTGGKGNDTLTGGSGADTFLWKAGHTGNDVITDFKAAEGDRLDLSDLLQGEKGSTIDNYLKMITVQGETVLQVSSDGKLNVNDGANHVDTTITLQGNNWSSSTINSLISGADPLIKVDSNNS